MLWKESKEGGKVVQVKYDDVTSITWMELYKTHQLGVYSKPCVENKFVGFDPKDKPYFSDFFQKHCGVALQVRQSSVSGKNWVTTDVNGDQLFFLVDWQEGIETSLSDVSNTRLRRGKNVVIDEIEFENVYLFDHQIRIPGTLWVYPLWLFWKETGGPKTVKVNTADIASLTWMEVPRSHQLSVITKDDVKYKLSGLVSENVSTLSDFFQKYCGIRPKVKQCSISGENRGIADVNGDRLSFLVDGKEAFEVALSDVSATRQEKKDVALEFNVDDRPVHSLSELVFHIPESRSAAVDFHDKLSLKPHEPAQ